MIDQADVNTIDTVARLIQLCVAPVFLLAGVAGVLNLFNLRLSRIIDNIDKLDKFEHANKHLLNDTNVVEKLENRRNFLSIRLKNTNLSILFGTATALLISVVILTMFLSAIFEFKDSLFVAILFILSMISLIISLILFLKEIFLTSTFIQDKDNYIY